MGIFQKNPYKIVNGQKIAKTESDYTEGDQKLADLRATNTNWRKLLLRNGVTNSHYLSMGGGDQKTNHYSSLSYFKQEGCCQTPELKDLTLIVE